MYTQYCSSFLAETFIAALVIVDLCIAAPALIPCPNTEWNDAVYLNGKCYVIIQNQGNDWYWAKDHCKSESISGKLMEPRTVVELELLLATDFVPKNAWIGVIGRPGDYRFDSDGSIANISGYFDPENVKCYVSQCCIRVFVPTQRFRDMGCINPYCKNSICETAVLRRYVLPLPRLTAANSEENPDIFLELIAETYYNETQIGIIYHTDSENSTPFSETVIMSNGTLVKNYKLLNLSRDPWRHIQISSVEIISFQTLTVTLVYHNESIFRRTLLYPSFHDLMDTIDDWPTYFTLVSSTRNEYNELSIVSLDEGDTHIKISFNCDGSSNNNCIELDTTPLRNPRDIEVILHQYYSANIRGKMYLDGIHLWASREVVVYVMTYEEPFVGNQTASTMKQIPPLHVGSTEYVSLRFERHDGTQYSFNKLLAIYPDTTVTTYYAHYLLLSGSTRRVGVRDYNAFHFKGNHPFQQYRTSSGNWNGYEDYCWGPLLPEELWKTEYTISLDWMKSLDTVIAQFVLSKALKIHFSNLISAGIMTCHSIIQINTHDVCQIKTEQLVAGQGDYTFKLPGKFGAYIMWTSGGEIRCQAMGVGNHDFDLPEFGNDVCRQKTVTTTTTTQHTSSVATVSTGTDSTATPVIFTESIVSGADTASASGTCTTSSGAGTSAHSGATSSVSAASLTSTINTAPTYTGPTASFANTSSPTTDAPTSLINCTCPVSMTKRTNLTVKEIENVVGEIKKTLHVDAKKTSSFTRKKICAIDERSSPTVLGYLGIVFFTLIFGSIIMSDVIPLFRWIDKRKKG